MSKVITGTVISIAATPRGGGGESITLGRATSMNIQEQYLVRPVFGIGQMHAQELPILQYSGAASIDQYAIDTTAARNILGQFDKLGNQDVDSFIRTLLFTEGVDVTIMRREKVDGEVVTRTLAKITGAVCTSESLSIQENSIVMRQGSFIYSEPVRIA